MTNSITITCRCGYQDSFSEAEEGLKIPCPGCDRDLLVTTDQRLFANTNLLVDDLNFAEEVPSEPAPRAPGPRTPPGRTRTAPERSGPQIKPRQRHSSAPGRPRKSNSSALIVGILVGIVVVGLGIFLLLNRQDRARREAWALDYSNRILKTIEDRNFELLSSERDVDFTELAETLDKLGGNVELSSYRQFLDSNTPDRYFLKFRAKAPGRAIEFKLAVAREGTGGRIEQIEIRPLTAAERASQ